VNPREISLSRCFAEGWEAFKAYPWLTIGGYAIYSVIGWVASHIPGINVLYFILAVFPLAGGFITLLLKILRRSNPRLEDLFDGFKDWVKWMGVGWLLILYVLIALIICGIPAAILVTIADFILGANSADGKIMIVIGGIITLVLLLIILMRWVFVYYVAADGANATQSIRGSTDLTEGIRFKLFWMLLVISLFAISGMVALFIGIFFTGAIAQCAVTALYLDVRQARTSPAPDI